jgi:hypothetical protein
MNLKEGIEKLKGLIEKFNVEPIVTTEQSFTEAKLMDGVTIIQYDAPELAQGVPVNVVTPEGILPMPDGEYYLEDGSMLVVMGGLVAEYEKAEAMPEGETNAPAAVAEPTTPATGEMEVKTAPKRVIKSQVEEHIFSLELEGFEPIKVDFSSMFKALVDENKALKDINKEMFGIVKAISNEPSVAPTEKVNKPFSVKEQRSSFKADILRIEKELNK